MSHIGVLKALEEAHVPIDLIVGTSIGSIVGGMYSAGYTADQIKQFTREIDWSNLYSDETSRRLLFVSQKNIQRHHLLQLRFDGLIPYIPESLSQGQRIFNIIYSRLLGANFQSANDFDNLKIPFRAIATDLLTGKRVVLSSGDLAEAITASMSIPLLFAPLEYEDMLLVDGGITDNLPIDVARNAGADYIIGVDVTSPLRQSAEMNAPWEIADQVITIMMKKPTEEKRREADFLLRPDLHNYRAGDFTHLDSVINIGYEFTRSKLKELKADIARKLSQPYLTSSKLGIVHGIDFEGDADSLIAREKICLKTQVGREVSRGDILFDLQNIYRTGYFQEANAVVDKDSAGLVVKFYLKPQPIIRSIKINHRQVLPDSIVQNSLGIPAGARLNVKNLYSHIDSLRNKYIRKGYSLASIHTIDYSPSDGQLTCNVNEGWISDIRVEGQRRTRKSIILREFPLHKGDIFNAQKAIQGINSIYSTQLFDRVSLKVRRENGKNILIIKVKEKKYLLMRLGGHASQERRTEGFLELREDNLFGNATKVSFFGSLGERNRRAEFSFYTFRLFNTYLTYRLSLYLRHRSQDFYQDFRKRNRYFIQRSGGQLVVGQQISRLGLISAELRIESVRVKGDKKGFPFDDSYRLRTLAFRSVLDKRDKIPFPTRGIYNRWSWEIGNQKFFQSSFSFTKVSLALEGYYSLNQQWVYHPFLRAGTADRTLPFSEFFGIGGQENFPGLVEKQKFGRQYVEAGLDVRYRLPIQLPIESYINLGYATAGVWLRPDDRIKRSDFLNSFHLTLALNSLFGPIKITYGSLVHHQGRFYFSIGYDF